MLQHFIRFRERYLVGSLAFGLLAPTAVLAQDSIQNPPGVPTIFNNFPNTIKNIFGIVILGAGILFVGLFLTGGVMYLTSAGNEENTKKARQLMLDAIIGLVIVVTSWSIGTFILKTLGISGATGQNVPISVIQ
jgi:hypothetical protein